MAALFLFFKAAPLKAATPLWRQLLQPFAPPSHLSPQSYPSHSNFPFHYRSPTVFFPSLMSFASLPSPFTYLAYLAYFVV